MCCASADRVVDDLLEAAHVRALLVRSEVHEAVEARRIQLLVDADDLLDVGHADARERDGEGRDLALDVFEREGHGHLEARDRT
jgi:hypothetical protein